MKYPSSNVKWSTVHCQILGLRAVAQVITPSGNVPSISNAKADDCAQHNRRHTIQYFHISPSYRMTFFTRRDGAWRIRILRVVMKFSIIRNFNALWPSHSFSTYIRIFYKKLARPSSTSPVLSLNQVTLRNLRYLNSMVAPQYGN